MFISFVFRLPRPSINSGRGPEPVEGLRQPTDKPRLPRNDDGRSNLKRDRFFNLPSTAGFFATTMVALIFCGIAAASELGSKEELDFSLEPPAAAEEPKEEASASPVAVKIDVPAAREEILVLEQEKTEKNKPASAEHVDTVETSDEKMFLQAASEEIKPAENSLSAPNKWFDLETGAGTIGISSDANSIPAGQVSAEVYSLKDCIDIAVKNHIPLQIAEKSVKLADMRVFEARRNMLPSVTLAFEPYTGKVNEQRYYGRKHYIEGQQPVFHGGELLYALKQAETNREITKNDRNKIRNELVLQVKKAYYTLAKAKDNLSIQIELSSEVDRIWQMVQAQYEALVATKLEYLNVGSQKSQVKYQIASADGDVDVAFLILKQAMNIDPHKKIDIRANLEFKRIDVDYDRTLSAAFNNRPEIIINMLMLDYYKYGKRIATAKGLPKLDLLGSWGLAKETYMPEDNAFNNTTGNGVNPGPIIPDQKLQQQWYAGIKTSLPVWGSTIEYAHTREQWVPTVATYQGTEAKTDSFKLKFLDNLAILSDKQLSEIDFDRARQELLKIQQDVTLEVKEQVFNYQKALIQLDTASNKVKYQSNDFEFMKMKRGLDEIPDSGVIESMIKLSQERFGYVQALSDCHIAIASINKAIGVEDYYKDE